MKGIRFLLVEVNMPCRLAKLITGGLNCMIHYISALIIDGALDNIGASTWFNAAQLPIFHKCFYLDFTQETYSSLLLDSDRDSL